MQLGDQLPQAMLHTRAGAPPGESARAPQAVPTPLQLPVTQQPPSPPHIPKDTRLRGALQYGDWLPVVPALAGPTLPWTPTERHHRTHHQKSFPPSPAGVKTAQSAEQQNPQHTYYWQARGAAPHRLPPARAPPHPRRGAGMERAHSAAAQGSKAESCPGGLGHPRSPGEDGTAPSPQTTESCSCPVRASSTHH